MEASVASPVNPPAESARVAMSPTPTEVEKEQSPVVLAELHKVSEDGAESDRARTDSDDEEEEPLKQQQKQQVVQEQVVQVEKEVEEELQSTGTPVGQHQELAYEDTEQQKVVKEKVGSPVAQEIDGEEAGFSTPREEAGPSTPREENDPTTPYEDAGPSTPREEAGPSTPREENGPTTPYEEAGPSTPREDAGPSTPRGDAGPSTPHEDAGPSTPQEGTPVGHHDELQYDDDVHGEQHVEDVASPVPESPREMHPGTPVDDAVEDHHGQKVELVVPSPKRPAPLNLVHHDIDDEASDSDEDEGSPAGEDDEEGADLGTPLGYGNSTDFGEGSDDLASHRFLGPTNPSDPSSVRALHGLRRVALHEKPPRFVSESSAIAAASSGSMTSTGSGESGRTSSSASGMHSADPKYGLRSQSEADYVEHPLNTYSLTFTEPVLGFNTNVVVSLENELLVEVWSVEKDSPAQRAGVVVGDYLISVNGQHIEPHMTKEQVFEIIQTSTVPRTLVFQRDVHDKDMAQSKSLPDKKNSPSKPLMGRLGAAMSQGASIIGSKWKRKKNIVHQNSFCDGCGMDPIVGALWTCSVCSNYNLCNDCYDLGTHGMENTEQMQALSEAIVQYKLEKKCKQFTQEFLLSLRRDICKGRPDKFEYLGGWIANIVVGTPATKITVRGIEIPSLPAVARQRFVSYLMPLVSNRTDIEVNIEWLPDDADHINAAERASVDRMSFGNASGDEDGADGPAENLEKLRIWISDKKTRTTSPFA